MQDLRDPALRTRMARAALQAGLAFSNTKTALAHSISYDDDAAPRPAARHRLLVHAADGARTRASAPTRIATPCSPASSTASCADAPQGSRAFSRRPRRQHALRRLRRVGAEGAADGRRRARRRARQELHRRRRRRPSRAQAEHAMNARDFRQEAMRIAGEHVDQRPRRSRCAIRTPACWSARCRRRRSTTSAARSPSRKGYRPS